MRAVDAEMIEHRGDIVGGAVLEIEGDRLETTAG